jgi:hypothetical protein
VAVFSELSLEQSLMSLIIYVTFDKCIIKVHSYAQLKW